MGIGVGLGVGVGVGVDVGGGLITVMVLHIPRKSMNPNRRNPKPTTLTLSKQS